MSACQGTMLVFGGAPMREPGKFLSVRFRWPTLGNAHQVVGGLVGRDSHSMVQSFAALSDRPSRQRSAGGGARRRAWAGTKIVRRTDDSPYHRHVRKSRTSREKQISLPHESRCTPEGNRVDISKTFKEIGPSPIANYFQNEKIESKRGIALLAKSPYFSMCPWRTLGSLYALVAH